ncbi:vascular endothelial growth factor D-like, partial [Scleropages formosus]
VQAGSSTLGSEDSRCNADRNGTLEWASAQAVMSNIRQKPSHRSRLEHLGCPLAAILSRYTFLIIKLQINIRGTDFINLSSSFRPSSSKPSNLALAGPQAGSLEKWEKDVRSAASLEELLMLTDFPDWKLWKCRLKLKNVESTSGGDSRSSSSSSSSSSAGSHRSTRYAAASYSLEILQGAAAVATKRLLTVIPFKYGPEPVLIKVANHTECKCMEPALIRRHVPTHRQSRCNPVLHNSGSGDSSRLCATGLIWDCMSDQCVPYPSSRHEFSPSPKVSDCEIDVDQCDCVSKNKTKEQPPCGLSSAACVTKGKRLELDSCR